MAKADADPSRSRFFFSKASVSTWNVWHCHHPNRSESHVGAGPVTGPRSRLQPQEIAGRFRPQPGCSAKAPLDAASLRSYNPARSGEGSSQDTMPKGEGGGMRPVELDAAFGRIGTGALPPPCTISVPPHHLTKCTRASRPPWRSTHGEDRLIRHPRTPEGCNLLPYSHGLFVFRFIINWLQPYSCIHACLPPSQRRGVQPRSAKPPCQMGESQPVVLTPSPRSPPASRPGADLC